MRQHANIPTSQTPQFLMMPQIWWIIIIIQKIDTVEPGIPTSTFLALSPPPAEIQPQDSAENWKQNQDKKENLHTVCLVYYEQIQNQYIIYLISMSKFKVNVHTLLSLFSRVSKYIFIN